MPHVHVRILSDARKYDGFTDAGGTIVFDGVVRGDYGIRAEADGYRFDQEAELSRGGPEQQTQTIVGVRTKLSRIGAVTARTQPMSSVAEVSRATDPAAAIAGNAAGGIASLSALSTSPDGSIVIHGHDGSTTATTLNGAPVFPSATKNQLGLLDADLFSAASFGSGAGLGAPNGTLNVQTYDPTIDWTGVLQARATSFGGLAMTAQERGTAGRVGLSFVHAQAEVGKPLDGLYFKDASGLAYAHHANPVSSGDAATFRYGFNATNVALLDVGQLSTTTPMICEAFIGPTPCAYAPSSRLDQTVMYSQLRDLMAFDRANLDLHLFSSRTSIANVFGEAMPGVDTVALSNFTSIARYGMLARLGLLFGGNRIANITVSSYRDTTHTNGSFVSSKNVPPFATSVSAVAISVPIVSARRLTVWAGPGLDFNSGTSHGTADARARYQLTNRDALTASFASGHLSNPQPSFRGLGDPTQLMFDCESGRTLGDGPLYSSGLAFATSQLRAGLQHSRDNLSVTVNAYRDFAANVAVNVIVPATALPGGPPSTAYLAAASEAASAECGRTFAVSPNALYYRAAAPVSRNINDGFDSFAQFSIGRNVHVTAAYSLSRALAFGSGFPFSRAGELVPGAQIPKIPLHRESLKVAASVARTVSVFAVVDYTGANNAYRATPFATMNMAARFSTSTGDIVFGVQNLANANAGPFGRFQPFPELTSPGLPRTYSLRYRLAAGRQGIDRATLLSPPLSTQQGFAFMPRDFEPLPNGEDWLAPDTQSPLCGREQVTTAGQYQDAIRAYDSAVEAALQANPELQDFPGSSFQSLALSYVRVRQTHAIRITITPGAASKVNAFMRCTKIHMGSYDDAQRLRIYSPGWRQRETRGFALFYSRTVGIYLPPEGVDETGGDLGMLRTGIPGHAASDPFAIDAATCPATYRAAVREAVADLKKYIGAVYDDRRAVAPDGFSASKHTAKAEAWLELRADDLAFGEAVVQCVKAPNVSLKELNARGLSGANFPSFDYAPSLGFYRATMP